MTDLRVGAPSDLDEERLPWLEAVEEDEGRDGPSLGKLIGYVLLGLLAIGLVVGGVFWLMDRQGGTTASGEPELIEAPEGPYKIKPADPGGMKVEGEGDTSFAASEGADPKGAIDIAAIPEEPLVKPAPKMPEPAQPKQAAAQPKETPKQAEAEPETPAETLPTSGGGLIQLGAFSSPAGATSAWKALSGRFTYLQPLTHAIIPVTNDGKTLYRLRASGPEAKGLCSRLRVAGESCVAIR